MSNTTKQSQKSLKPKPTTESSIRGTKLRHSAKKIIPAKKLIEIMDRSLIVLLALGSVTGAALLCLICIFLPTLIPSHTARFFLCLLIAFFFAVFVFTLYPSDYKIDIGKKINITFVLVGPAALWIGLFLLFWNLLPLEDIAGKVFKPDTGSSPLYYSTTWISNWKPTQPIYYKLRTPNNQSDDIGPYNLEGFYIQFDTAHNKYTAEIKIAPSDEEPGARYEVEFDRGNSTFHLKPLGGNKEENQ